MSSPLPSRSSSSDGAVRWIAGFNVFKGLLLLGFAFGILRFLHKDVDEIVGNWMSMWGVDLESPRIAALLERLDLVTDRQLKQLSGLTFAYAGLFLTEGTGLLFRQRWAKFFTIYVTASFVPIEIFETLRHFGWIKVALLLTNVAIVVYLIANLRREKRAMPPPVAQPEKKYTKLAQIGAQGVPET